MKYKYVAAYEIHGLSHSLDTGDVEVYAAEDGYPVKAVLAERVDDHCYELDRAQALGNLVLKSLVGQEESDDLIVEVKAEINRIRERRKKDLDGSELLIFTAEGEVKPDFSRPSRETDEFVLGFELINKSDITSAHSAQLNAALTALYLSVEHESIQVNRIQRGIYLLNESGKPVYSFDMSASASAFVSKRTTDEVVGEVRSRAVRLAAENSLATVNRLLVQAISRENDKLRRFMFGWSALEILVNKVFTEYEKTLFVSTQPRTNPAGYRHKQKVVDRIRAVMKSKYSITDKFAVIAACLDDSSEKDEEAFTSIKKERDKMFHGEAIDEDCLPIAETIKLLKKYLRLHISKKVT
jgi:hypothetical protein